MVMIYFSRVWQKFVLFVCFCYGWFIKESDCVVLGVVVILLCES